MTPETKETLSQYANGLITKSELHAQLEEDQVRGQADMGSYVGYDYRNQEWIQVHFYDLRG